MTDQILSPTVAANTLVGTTVVAVDFEDYGEDLNGERGYIKILLDNGCSVHADYPAIYK